MNKIAKELLAIAMDLTDFDVIERMRLEFPFHDTLNMLDDSYGVNAAYNYEEMTPPHVLKLFKRAYGPWKDYMRKLSREARGEKRLRRALQTAELAERYFKLLADRPLKDWQGGYVTLLARLKRAHEALYGRNLEAGYKTARMEDPEMVDFFRAVARMGHVRTTKLRDWDGKTARIEIRLDGKQDEKNMFRKIHRMAKRLGLWVEDDFKSGEEYVTLMVTRKE